MKYIAPSARDKTFPQSEKMDHRKVSFKPGIALSKWEIYILLRIHGSSHTDLYDRSDIIPFDRIVEFYNKNIK